MPKPLTTVMKFLVRGLASLWLGPSIFAIGIAFMPTPAVADDCNGNGIDDACDLDCGEVGGPCDVPGCGQGTDCNANGSPDECDIAGGSSWDLDFNAVPDDCVFPLVRDRARPCGRMYLAPGGAPDAIRVFTRTGRPSGVLLPGGIQSSEGTRTFDAEGNLLVSQWETDKVLVISTDGEVVREITSGGLNGPTAATVTPTGGIAVCSYLTDSVKFYTHDGSYLSNLSVNIEDPHGIAYDRSGNLYVANRDNGHGFVAKFDPDNAPLTTFGQGLMTPHPLDLAFNSAQTLYVTTPTVVRKFDRDGNHLGDVSAPGLAPSGIAIDENDHLWVTNWDALEIYHFDAAEALVEIIPLDFGASPPASLTLWGIALGVLPDADCNGNGESDACEMLSSSVPDCQPNGIPDECELEGNDCNANGVPDECEPDCNGDAVPDDCQLEGNDCNGNGVPDDCDPDCDGDGVPDDCQLEGNDCNGDGIPDDCQLVEAGALHAPPGSVESELNFHHYALTPAGTWAASETLAIEWGGHLATIRSAEENAWLLATFLPLTTSERVFIGFNDIVSEGVWRWSSGEGVSYTNWLPSQPDNYMNEDVAEFVLHHSEWLPGMWNDERTTRVEPGVAEVVVMTDCNGNGVLDECDIASGASADCDQDGVPDECQPQGDCNNNGVQDLCDIAAGTSQDCQGDLIPDECQLYLNDCDNNGVPDSCEDCNENGLGDYCDVAWGFAEDCNGNFIPDECEPDCNENGVVDACDISAGASYDFNANDIPDECEADCNGNGFPDFLDIAFEFSEDCNANDVPDECDLDQGASADCNVNLVPDECDIASGWSGDCDSDSVPDECEPDGDGDAIPDDCDQPGDFDHNAIVDLRDYEAFAICLMLSGPDEPPLFDECAVTFDFDEDGDIDLSDFASLLAVLTYSP